MRATYFPSLRLSLSLLFDVSYLMHMLLPDEGYSRQSIYQKEKRKKKNPLLGNLLFSLQYVHIQREKKYGRELIAITTLLLVG